MSDLYTNNASQFSSALEMYEAIEHAYAGKFWLRKELPQDTANVIFSFFKGASQPRTFNPGSILFKIPHSGVVHRKLKTIVKKATLYTSHTYIDVPYEISGMNYSMNDWGNFPIYKYSIPPDLIKLLLFLKPFMLSDCISIVPKTIAFKDTWNDMSTTSSPSEIIPVTLQQDFLKQQFTESAAARVFFPMLMGVRSKDLISIRQDNEAAFYDFQRSLSKMLSGRIEDGSVAIFEMMQEVDHNVRIIEEMMKSMRRESWFNTLKLSIVPIPLMLTFGVSEEVRSVVQTATGMLGSYSLFSYVKGLRDIYEKRQKLRQDPFYLPWLLHSKRKKK